MCIPTCLFLIVIDWLQLEIFNLIYRYIKWDWYFSGGFDKNGIEIFGGDIISFEDGSTFEVVYMRGAFGYISDISSDFITLNETNLSIAEVVGNVYQKK